MNKLKFKSEIVLAGNQTKSTLKEGSSEYQKTDNINYAHKSARSGFTIIEVVLVLAIAGLIFLMVFIALPALQRNQRDSQRKNDVGKAMAALRNYQSNNKGAVPSDWNIQFRDNYLKVNGESFVDPDGSEYGFYFGTVGTIPTRRKSPVGELSMIHIFRQAECAQENTRAVAGSNKAAFSIVLEGGGVYCVNN